MNHIGNNIADSLNLGLGYADRLLKDIPASKFARYAIAGNSSIVSNHPAFVYGHLSLYAPRIVEQLGQDASAVAVPDQYETLFSHEAECQDDPDGKIYPAMDEVTSTCINGYKAALDVLRSTNDDVFYQPNPMEGRLLELFPTIGSMHAFYAGGHFMMHMGQLSAWRRMMGLGPA